MLSKKYLFYTLKTSTRGHFRFRITWFYMCSRKAMQMHSKMSSGNHYQWDSGSQAPTSAPRGLWSLACQAHTRDSRRVSLGGGLGFALLTHSLVMLTGSARPSHSEDYWYVSTPERTNSSPRRHVRDHLESWQKNPPWPWPYQRQISMELRG